MTDEPKTDAPTGGDKYKRLIAAAQKATRIKVAVAHPCDDVSLSGAIEAHKLGLIDPILVGPPERIRNAARDAGLDISPFELVASAHSHDSAAKAVGLVTAGRVEALMKGSLHTDELMSAVVAHEGGIRTERRISHCFIMDVPRHNEPLIVDRRIPDHKTLIREVGAWVKHRNLRHAKADWRFTTDDARIKLKHLYPVL